MVESWILVPYFLATLLLNSFLLVKFLFTVYNAENKVQAPMYPYMVYILHMCVYIYTCIYIRIYTCVYIYIHVYM